MTSWKDKPLVVLDTETTGIEHGQHRVIELAWLVWQEGVVLEQHSMLLQPYRSLEPKITEITGITTEMLRHAIDFSEGGAQLEKDIRRAAALVAYNAPFDIGHLRHEVLQSGRNDWISCVPALDPLVWVRHFDKYVRGKKLTQIADYLGIAVPGDPHRALTDCHLCAGVMAHYMPRLLEDLGELAAWQIDKRAEQEADFQRWLARQKKAS